MFLNPILSSWKRAFAACLCAVILSPAVLAADQAGQDFASAKLRSEYLKMPAAELAPMLDWLEARELTSDRSGGQDQPAAPRISPTLLHGLILHGKNAEALSLIKTARAGMEKPLQRDVLFMVEELMVQARIEAWDESHFEVAATQRVAALPWPAARSRLKQLLQGLDIQPLDKTLEIAVASDPAYRIPPLNSPRMFVSDIVDTRFLGEVCQPRAGSLINVIKARLAAKAGEPGYWQVRAYPPLSGKEQAVRVAVWEPDGVDMALFKHPTPACLVLAPGKDCVVDPQLDGFDRSQSWALVQGYRDVFDNKDTPERQAWQKWQGQLALKNGELSGDPSRKDELNRHLQRMAVMTGEVAQAQNRQHGTHVAGIIVDGNPFVDVVAIRDAYTVALPAQLDAQEWKDRFERIAVFLKQHDVRIVNMSWGRSRAEISVEHAAAIRQHMLALMAALPDTLFVAAAGNDDHAVDKSGFLPAGLDAPNLLTVGAVDQDGQITYFSNIGAALYADGDSVRSLGPGGYPLEMSGTSMAAPQVCNVAARLLGRYPGLSVAELKQLLIDGADELPAGEQIATPIKVLNPARSAALSVAAPSHLHD